MFLFFTLYFSCKLRHSQFLHNSCGNSPDLKKKKKKTFCFVIQCPLKMSAITSLYRKGLPAFTGRLLICVFKGLLDCLLFLFFFCKSETVSYQIICIFFSFFWHHNLKKTEVHTVITICKALFEAMYRVDCSFDRIMAVEKVMRAVKIMAKRTQLELD